MTPATEILAVLVAERDRVDVRVDVVLRAVHDNDPDTTSAHVDAALTELRVMSRVIRIVTEAIATPGSVA